MALQELIYLIIKWVQTKYEQLALMTTTTERSLQRQSADYFKILGRSMKMEYSYYVLV